MEPSTFTAKSPPVLIEPSALDGHSSVTSDNYETSLYTQNKTFVAEFSPHETATTHEFNVSENGENVNFTFNSDTNLGLVTQLDSQMEAVFKTLNEVKQNIVQNTCIIQGLLNTNEEEQNENLKQQLQNEKQNVCSASGSMARPIGHQKLKKNDQADINFSDAISHVHDGEYIIGLQKCMLATATASPEHKVKLEKKIKRTADKINAIAKETQNNDDDGSMIKLFGIKEYDGKYVDRIVFPIKRYLHGRTEYWSKDILGSINCKRDICMCK